MPSERDGTLPTWQVYICYGCKPNRALLKSYGFVQRDNPVDFTVVAGGVASARSVFDAWRTSEEGVSGGDIKACDLETEWRARVQLVAQCGVLADVEKMQLTAAGPSGQAVAGLRILLCDGTEFAALAAERDVSARLEADLSVGAEQRVHAAVLALCGEAIASGEPKGPAGSGGACDEMETAKAYRQERYRLLRAAMKKVENSARLTGDLGVVVASLEDGWLDRQQHDMLRSMNNLGF